MVEVTMDDFQGYVKEALQLLLLSLDHLLWRKPDSMPGGDSWSPVERPTWAGTETPGQQPSTNLPVMCVNYFGSGPSNPSQAFRWLQPCLEPNCNFMRESEPELSSQAAPKFPTHRNDEREWMSLGV